MTRSIIKQIESMGYVEKVFRVNGTVEIRAVSLREREPQVDPASVNDSGGRDPLLKSGLGPLGRGKCRLGNRRRRSAREVHRADRPRQGEPGGWLANPDPHPQIRKRGLQSPPLMLPLTERKRAMRMRARLSREFRSPFSAPNT